MCILMHIIVLRIIFQTIQRSQYSLESRFRKIVDRRLPALALLTQKSILKRDVKQTPEAIAEAKQKI